MDGCRFCEGVNCYMYKDCGNPGNCGPCKCHDSCSMVDYVEQQREDIHVHVMNQFKENDMKETKFDFDTSQVKGNALNSLEVAKNAIVQMQQGKSVLIAVKTAIKNAPGSPDALKMLMDTPYGDMVVGLVLHTIAPVLTSSPMVIKAVKSANIAGAVEISNQFTMIQDSIEQAITTIPGFASEAIADEAFVTCNICGEKAKELFNGQCRACRDEEAL